MSTISGADEVDPFDEFNRAMGADGDASPHAGFAVQRARGAVSIGYSDGSGDDEQFAMDDAFDLQLYTAYSFDAVQQVLAFGDDFSSSGYAEVMGAVFGRSILEMDEPEHHEHRSLVQQAFTRSAMEQWERDVVAPLIDRMVDGFAENHRLDLVRELLFPFPVNVIAELLGLPPADLPRFHRLAVEMIGVMVDMDRAIESSSQLRDYFRTLIDERRGSDGPDLLAVLTSIEHDGVQLSDDEIFAFLRLLLPAGAETTYRSSSNLLFGLLSHPDQLDALRADRSLMPQAIEEGLRWEPPLTLIARSTLTEVDVCGTTMPAGSAVIACLGSANRDESRWDDADSFDIFRDRKPHLAFAHGPHMCLGMHLARMETTVVLNTLFDRLPNLRLDPDAGDQFISGMAFRAPPRLDVFWD
jgi:cytochrome P450